MNVEYQLQQLDQAEQAVRQAMRCVYSIKVDQRAVERMLEQFHNDILGILALRSSVRESHD